MHYSEIDEFDLKSGNYQRISFYKLTRNADENYKRDKKRVGENFVKIWLDILKRDCSVAPKMSHFQLMKTNKILKPMAY